MRFRWTTLLGMGLLLTAGSASAQTTVSGSISLTVPQVLALDVTNATQNLGTVTAADYGNTDFAGTGGPYYATSGTASSLSTLSNVAHDVTLSADQANFNATDATNAANKVAGDMEYRISTDGGSTWSSWTSINTVAANVLTAEPSGRHGDVASIEYRVKLDLATDMPTTAGGNETYTLPFTYTIVAN